MKIQTAPLGCTSRQKLLELGATPLSEREFYGYLKLDIGGVRHVYEPENVRDIDNCAYILRNRFPLSSD